MNWKSSAAPSQLNSCECGSEDVEERPDGLVTQYRCADCGSSLGDITIGHEP
jgi:predicted SprT family Zn-dependent metalloprotease